MGTVKNVNMHFLILHSMLHLFGYDHMTPEEAAIMEGKQTEILNEMNILR